MKPYEKQQKQQNVLLHSDQITKVLLDIQKDPLVAEVLNAKKQHVDGADFEDISLHIEQEDNDEVYVNAIA